MKGVYFLKCDRISYIALDDLAYLQFGKINRLYSFIHYLINFYFSMNRHGYRGRFAAVLQQQFDIFIFLRN